MTSTRRVTLNIFSGIFMNFYRVAIQVVMLPLMARLLGPAEMGLYILALPIINFVMLLSDAGMEQSLAREKDDSSPAWSSAFWGLLGGSIILSGLAYAASFVAADLAGQPRLPLIILVLTATLVMTTLTVVPRAKITRDGRMTIMAKAEVLGQTLSAGLAIYMAFNGFGVWSMVAQFVLLNFIKLIWVYVETPYKPQWLFHWPSMGTHWGVGGAILISRLTDMFGRIVENTVVSRTLGTSALGSYGYANQIARFFSDSVCNAVWANLYYLLIKAPADQVSELYLRFNRLLALLLLPFAGMFALSLPILFPLLLGDKWNEAIHPTMLLVVSTPFAALASLHSTVMINTNRSRIMVLTTLIASAMRIIGMAIGFPYGIMGMAIGLSVCNLLQYVLVILFISPLVGNSVSSLIKAVLGPICASLVAAGAFYITIWALPSLIGLFAGGFLATGIYALTLYVLDARRTKDDLSTISGLLKKKGAEE
jgi:O-antigen/teichoic acid export membrane protein